MLDGILKVYYWTFYKHTVMI